MKFNFFYFTCLGLFLFTQITFAQDTLTIEQAVQTALQNNYGIQLVRNQVDIAKVNNNWGAANALPTISAGGGYTYSNTNLKQSFANGNPDVNRTGVANNVLNANITLSWTIFDGMRMFATKDRLEELQKIGELNLQNQVNQTAYNVSLAYYNLVRLRQQVGVTEEFIALLEERVKIAQRAFDIGSSAKTELLQSQIDLQDQRIILAQQKNEIVKAIANLNNLLVKKSEETALTAQGYRFNETLQLEDLRSNLDKQNIDIQIIQRNIYVQMLAQKEAKAAQLPTVQLNTGYNFNSNKSAAGLILLNQTYGPTAGVTVRIPLFQGNQLKNQIRVSELNIKNQQIQIENVKNNLNTTLYNAWQDYQNAIQIRQQQAQNLELAKENANIAFEQFKQRQIRSIDLRQVQLNYQQIQNSFINAGFTVKNAELNLQLLTASFKTN